MKNILVSMALLVCPLFLVSGCGGAAPTTQAEASAKSDCTCAQGKAGETVWCEACGHGFVKGKKTGCKACFDGKSGKTTWCDKCGHGFVDGKKTGCKGCYKAKSEGKACGGCSKPKPPKEKAPAEEKPATDA